MTDPTNAAIEEEWAVVTHQHSEAPWPPFGMVCTVCREKRNDISAIANVYDAPVRATPEDK